MAFDGEIPRFITIGVTAVEADNKEVESIWTFLSCLLFSLFQQRAGFITKSVLYQQIMGLCWWAPQSQTKQAISTWKKNIQAYEYVISVLFLCMRISINKT